MGGDFKYMKLSIIIALLSWATVSFSKAQTSEAIKALAMDKVLRGGSFSIKAIDIETGETYCDYSSQKEMIPASVTKLLTTATALRILGADFTYKTILSYSGNIKGGVLVGDLYIKGSGDPTLGSSYIKQASFLKEWVSSIRKAGIRQIKGRIIADESYFDTEGISLYCSGNDLGSYYTAGSYGLNVFDNRYTLFIRSGSNKLRPWITKTEPADLGITFTNYLVADEVSTDSMYIIGYPFIQKRSLYGVVPTNRKQIVCKGDLPDPALYLATVFKNELKKQGISVGDKATCFRLLHEEKQWKKPLLHTLHTHSSPKLSEIIQATNYASLNLYADALIKTIGKYSSHKKKKGLSSYGLGIEAVHGFWQKQAVDCSSLWIYDGSGLSRNTAMTTDFVCKLLCKMADNCSFRTSIPTVGKHGSVRYFLKNTALDGKAQLKSGSMTRVKCYAGYIKKGEKTYAIAVFANNYNCSGKAMTLSLQRLLLKLFH